MNRHRLIPTPDVAEAGHLGLGLGCEPAAAEQLGLEGGEEALGHGVVIGVTDRHVLSVAPLRTGLAVDNRRFAMVVVVDPAGHSPSEKDLAEFFGLSPAEARLFGGVFVW